MKGHHGVMKCYVITLMMLILGINVVNAVSVGSGSQPNICPEDFPPYIWSCRYDVSNLNTNLTNFRINNSFFEGETIQGKFLVLNKYGINRLESFSGSLNILNGTGKSIKINCSEDLSTNEILESCNAKIAEEKITSFNLFNMKYYVCSVIIVNSTVLNGEYVLNLQATDLTGLTGSDSTNHFFLNPKLTFPNPEAIINYDSSSKDLTILGNSEKITINKTEKCLNRACTRKTENYTLVNEYGNKLYLLVQHDKSNIQDTINLLSIKYNSNKEIKINKFSIRETKDQLYLKFSNKTSSIGLDKSKKSTKTKVQIKENRKINNSITYQDWAIEIKTVDGILIYNRLPKEDTSLFPDYNSTVGCNWRANISGVIFPQCMGFEIGQYFDGKQCRDIHSCYKILNLPAGERFLEYEECEKCK